MDTPQVFFLFICTILTLGKLTYVVKWYNIITQCNNPGSEPLQMVLCNLPLTKNVKKIQYRHAAVKTAHGLKDNTERRTSKMSSNPRALRRRVH